MIQSQMVDKVSQFYNRSLKSWLQDNDIEMYSSTHYKGKSVVAEKFIRALKNKIYKYMTSVSTNLYIDNLADIVNQFNNIYHSRIKMKPVDVKSSIYIGFNKEDNKEDPKFQIGDYVRILKYQNIFAKGYTPNWSEVVFVIKKDKNAVPLTDVISDLNAEDIAGTFYEKELQKPRIKKSLELKKVIKRKGNELCVKWKDYDSYFNSWIDKEDIF